MIDTACLNIKNINSKFRDITTSKNLSYCYILIGKEDNAYDQLLYT